MGKTIGKGHRQHKSPTKQQNNHNNRSTKKINVKIDDIVLYVEDDKGNIIIKKEQLKPI
jgi:hypothetical protein